MPKKKEVKKTIKAVSSKKTAPKKAVKKSEPKKKTASKKASSPRIARKDVPKERYKRAAPPTVEVLDRLLERGQLRGFLTDNEVVFAFGDIEDHVGLFEGFLDLLEEKGVHFIEIKEGFLGHSKSVDDINEKIRVKADARVDFSDVSQDSIQMYLREIGKIPL